jgi:hypothetical protein
MNLCHLPSLSLALLAVPGCRSQTTVAADASTANPSTDVEGSTSMLVPFEPSFPAPTGSPSPGLSQLIYDDTPPPAFESVRVYRPSRGAFLIAVWAGGREAVEQTLAMGSVSPPAGISVVSVEAKEVTGSPPAELLFTYDLKLDTFTERRLLICVAGGQQTCSVPITTVSRTPEGTVQFQATVTFPAPGLLEYAEAGKVRRALFLPHLWRVP